MKNKKILIAEDYYALREGLILAFEDLGYEVSGAENGKKALELITKEQPDLLITDFDMPVLNGFELINKLGEKGYTFPIIVNSGAIEDIKKEEIKYEGKLELRDKISSIEELFEKVEEFLN